jgi:hypothetical protein
MTPYSEYIVQSAPLSPPRDLRRALTFCCTLASESMGLGESYRRATAIDMLPDDVLLEIFDLYRKGHYNHPLPSPVWEWHILVHVCRRWRQIIFGSPRRLDLQILCTYKTPVRKILGHWPDFPIAVDFHSLWRLGPNVKDNAIAALEYPDRVCTLSLSVIGEQLGRIAAVMLQPFPVLTCLEIYMMDSPAAPAPVLPAEFLGGSAPCSQKITLYNIPYPALPTLLLSARDLVSLDLRRIPQTGYISPEIMVASLAALPRLERLTINFQSVTSRPYRQPPPLLTRTVIPCLNFFHFQGACEYLEDLVARIHSPKLNRLFIACLDHHVDNQVTQLSKFIDRSVGSEITPFR